MNFLILFTILCSLQYIYYLLKKSDIEDYKSIAVDVVDCTNLSKRKVHKRSIIFLINIESFFKRFLFAGIILMVIVNGLISIILGSVIHLILLF